MIRMFRVWLYSTPLVDCGLTSPSMSELTISTRSLMLSEIDVLR